MMYKFNFNKEHKLSFLSQSMVVSGCYSIVELETSWEKETCIHVELGNFIFVPIWFWIVLYINRLFVINETYC